MWLMTTWPTPEATRSVAKSRSSHAILCGDPPDNTSFNPVCRRTSWARSSVKRSQCSSDRNEQTVALDDQRIPLQNHSHRRQNRQKPRAKPTKDRLIPKTSLPNRHDYHLNHCFLQSPHQLTRRHFALPNNNGQQILTKHSKQSILRFS